ncbi:39S ribosomal protein L36, mitochondrial [Orchesella cincta]|uniref:39S ribosomal protein L36, mitochondrial n=1 Tax=Orchesella cincta TaxID=48709 RepID=A0A1D2NC74_ORCCI|nr:39S ribosomal protein L36, mitochondrial [Orchesella cincta]
MWNIPWNFSISRILSKDLATGINRIINIPVPAAGAVSRSVAQLSCRCTNDNDALVQKAIPTVFARSYTTMRTSIIPCSSSTPTSWKACSILSSSVSVPLFGNLCNVEGDNRIVAGTYIQSRGLKIMGKVRRRCKDCFMTWINGNLWNLCKTQQRHKQMLKAPYFSNQRVLTHATQKPKRDW